MVKRRPEDLRTAWEARVLRDPCLTMQTYCGIDWGERECAYAVLVDQQRLAAHGKFRMTETGLQAMLAEVGLWADPVTGVMPPFVLEPTRRPLVDVLLQREQRVLMVGPHALASQRAVRGLAAKSDARDACDLARIAQVAPDMLHAVAPVAPDAAALGMLVRDREQAQRDLVALGNRLRSVLAEYFPQFLAAFDATDLISRPAAWALLREARTHQGMTRLSLDEVGALVQPTGGRQWRATADRVTTIFALADPPLVYPPGTETVMADYASRIVDQIETQHAYVKRLESETAAAVLAHPTTRLIAPATGLGPALTAALLATVIARIDEFENVQAMLAWSGQVPVPEQSGGHARAIRRTGKTTIARTCFLWASGTAMYQPVARHWYYDMRAHGKGRGTAIRKIAVKLLRGLWHCAHTGEVWNDDSLWRTTLTPEQLTTQTTEFKALAKSRRPPAVAQAQDNPRKITRDTLSAYVEQRLDYAGLTEPPTPSTEPEPEELTEVLPADLGPADLGPGDPF